MHDAFAALTPKFLRGFGSLMKPPVSLRTTSEKTEANHDHLPV
jgi:hypothetical protein